MTKHYLFLLAVLVSFATSAQKRTVDSFTMLDVFGPFDIELIKADAPAIEITYNGIDEADVVQEVHRDVLKLKLKNRHYMQEWSSSHNTYRKSRYLKVKVYYTDIDEIELEAGARVISQESLKSKNLVISSSMGAEIDLDIIAKNVLLRSSMGAVVDLSGRVENLEVRASMGSELHLSHLESKIGYIKATMGSTVTVNVTEELEASAGFGAVINYTGGASVRHTNSSMGAEIRRR